MATKQVARFAVPSVVYLGRPAEEDEETAEVFAYAFSLISKEYFRQKNKLEDALAEKLNKISSTRNYYVLVAFLFIISIALTFAVAPWMLLLGIFAILGMFLVHWKIEEFQREASRLNGEIASLKIDKKITFVSKLYVPVYLIPYKNGSMIFDALGKMPTVTMPIYNLPSDKIKSSFDKLQEELTAYEDLVIKKNVLTTVEIESYDSEIKNERFLERKVLTALKDITNCSSNVERTDVSIQIYGPETPLSKSIQALFARGLPYKRENKLDTVEVRFTLNDAMKTVERMGGIKTTALEEDIVSAVKGWTDEIRTNRILDLIRNTLISNIEKSKLSYDKMIENCKAEVFDYICPECVRKTLTSTQASYKLVTMLRDYLGTAEAGFRALNDESNLKAFQDRLEEIEKNVKLYIPEDIIAGIIDYTPAGIIRDSENVICNTHGEISEKITIPSYLSVFASTGASIFEELRKPVIDNLRSSSQAIEQIYLSTRGQELELFPLEEIQNRLKLKSKELEAVIREAEMTLSSLRRTDRK